MFEFGMRIKLAVLRLLVLAGVGLGFAAGAGASPVTFRFEAEVGPPNTVSPFDVPFSLSIPFEEGDVITGLLTIEPRDAEAEIHAVNTVIVQTLAFDINGVRLETSQYSISVQDDFTAIDGPLFPVDEVRLSCSPFTGRSAACAPNTIPSDSNVLWGASFWFQGPFNTLVGADIPEGEAAWNQFSKRILNMSFRESNGPGIMRLKASVRNFQVVPEPSSLIAALIGITFFSCLQYRL